MKNTTDENPLRELLDELISSLERLEARSEAIHQFLIGKRKVTEKSLAPYMEQAANASEVRWRAFRVRAAALLAAGTREAEKTSKPEQSKLPTDEKKEEAQKAEPLGKELKNAEGGEKAGGKDRANEKSEGAQAAGKSKEAAAPEKKQGEANASDNKPDEANARTESNAEGEKQAGQAEKSQPEKNAPAKSVA